MILTIAPILGASLIAASLTVDEFHNWVSRACFTGARLQRLQIRARQRRDERMSTAADEQLQYDCLGGAVTGTFCAIIAYRKNFAALWDFRFNHILLPRRSLPPGCLLYFHSHQSCKIFAHRKNVAAEIAASLAKQRGWRMCLR